MKRIRAGLWRAAGALVLGMALSGSAMAAPSPPPPTGLMELADRLAAGPPPGQVEAYADLFRDDVKVFENGVLVAEGRAAWTAYLKRYGEVHAKVLEISYGDPIMVAESLDNISYRGPNVVQDCCVWARVAFYHLGSDRRVDVVRFQTNHGGYWGRPEQAH